jgi:hypothetical protein
MRNEIGDDGAKDLAEAIGINDTVAVTQLE